MAGSVFVIVNPAAGAGRAARLWPKVAARLGVLGHDYQFEMTRGKRTAEGFVRQALRAGFETFVVVGGDGVVNEVVNGLLVDDHPATPGIRLVIVPAGSSSDIARGLALRPGVEAIEVLRTGQVVALDAGRATVFGGDKPEVRYFLNSGDVGIGSRISHGALPHKPLGGKIAFFLASIQAIRDPQPWAGRVKLDDGEAVATRAISLVAALGPYTGGGMRIAPGAKWDDGLFDVVTIDAMDTRELLLAFPSIYSGTHVDHPKVHVVQARSVLIEIGGGEIDGGERGDGAMGGGEVGDPETGGRLDIQVDGEAAGHGAVEFRILPGVLPVYVPKP